MFERCLYSEAVLKIKVCMKHEENATKKFFVKYHIHGSIKLGAELSDKSVFAVNRFSNRLLSENNFLAEYLQQCLSSGLQKKDLSPESRDTNLLLSSKVSS